MKTLLMGRALFIFLILFSLQTAYAQVIPVGEPVEKKPEKSYTILPIAAFTSDEGLFGGVILQRINYGGGEYQPFLSNIRAEILGTTRGKIESRFDYERMNMFGMDIRNLSRFELLREPRSTYYGIGNNTLFSDTEFEDGRFYYSRYLASASFMARKNLFQYSEVGKFDGVFRLTVSYKSLDSRGENTVFFDDHPTGADGGWINKAGIGLIVDNRRSEFAPTAGYRYEIGGNLSGSYLGSVYSFGELFLDIRHYISPLFGVVFAQKFVVRHSTGDTPFWQRPVLGNQRGLRGYPLNRFIGDSSLLHILETRKWLFSVFDDGVKVGAHLFLDSGRVFSRFDSNAILDDWKNTYGAGVAMTLFNPDLIIRAEMGISEESTRIYAGIGYLF